MSTFIPIRDRVLVEPAQQVEMSKGGIYLAKEDVPTEGTVLAAGPGLPLPDGTLLPLSVKVGDVVIFPKNAGTNLVLDGVKYIVLQEFDILVIKS